MTKKVINELAIWRLQRDEIGKDHADYEFRFNFCYYVMARYSYSTFS